MRRGLPLSRRRFGFSASKPPARHARTQSRMVWRATRVRVEPGMAHVCCDSSASFALYSGVAGAQRNSSDTTP